VEAGLRSFNRQMPEEINRVITDHISSLLLCPTHISVDNLRREGINNGVYLVGDVMFNALMWAIEQNRIRPDIIDKLGLIDKKYILGTVHRAENTDNPNKLSHILDAFNNTNELVIFPAHPRTVRKIKEMGFQHSDKLRLIEPQSYLDMIKLESHASVIFTDSGGVQKEAYWLKVPCITLRDETEWIETVESGWNVLSGTDSNRIISSYNSICQKKYEDHIPGKLCSVDQIIDLLIKFR
jgi:UDP-N-acetylglucosamine 2-epimerase